MNDPDSRLIELAQDRDALGFEINGDFLAGHVRGELLIAIAIRLEHRGQPFVGDIHPAVLVMADGLLGAVAEPGGVPLGNPAADPQVANDLRAAGASYLLA